MVVKNPITSLGYTILNCTLWIRLQYSKNSQLLLICSFHERAIGLSRVTWHGSFCGTVHLVHLIPFLLSPAEKCHQKLTRICVVRKNQKLFSVQHWYPGLYRINVQLCRIVSLCAYVSLLLFVYLRVSVHKQGALLVWKKQQQQL